MECAPKTIFSEEDCTCISDPLDIKDPVVDNYKPTKHGKVDLIKGQRVDTCMTKKSYQSAAFKTILLLFLRCVHSFIGLCFVQYLTVARVLVLFKM